MTDEKEGYKNYIDRHRNWQNKAIDQLSYANNFLLTITVGLLAFVFEKDVFSKIHFCICDCSFNWPLTLYSFSLFFTALAILTGIFVLVSRLYDFRISRHITLIRKRFYKYNQDISEQNKNAAILWHKDFKEPNFCQQIGAIVKVIFKKIKFLEKSEMEILKSSFPRQKFEDLREFSFRLGFISWKWTKLQGLYFAMSVLLYCIYLWAK